ncbi:alpha-L-fucosidase [Aureibaculum sp. 2210JD6-5]|uniref:alpha-L-fucosidase n=1 Tax=Aureibaculum sp. 2210JD6-5 TaxID=3103957 RepID=UPI002AAD062F|nr:alpha-L-fucosidase [Aureibaculum sp. 2210JD6-5]MDY7396966.1 alpha-L-fucosidase [Aureibaculum sp. 2210JD6-5]
MKLLKIVSILLTLTINYNVNAQHFGGGEANPDLKTNSEALKNFQDMRFGMFIHWGPVVLRGTEISWSRGKEVPIDDYDNLYKEFNPVLFNAADWVKAAKDAGMKYIVLTTRHHDGFCLWDSKYTDYDMASTPYGKGVVKELVEECKKQDIVFGAYYTICDWYHEDYPVTYPADDYKFHLEKEITNPEVKKRMDNYVVYMKNQLKELIDDYDPAFIWFDGEWEWAWTHEMGMDMYKYLRGLKDDLLINNRVDKGREGMSGTTKSNKFAGDYATPEQEIGKFDNKNAWESCMTIANQWAWKANDKMKSKKECIQTLLRTVGGDGNLLFNVGPMADGRIEQRQIDRLKEMGDWLKINGEAVYGTRGGPYLPTEYMVSTHKGNNIYLHLLNKEDATLALPIVKGIKIKKVYFLDGKTPLKFNQEKNTINIGLPKMLPDDIASVIVLELNKTAATIDVINRMNY